MKPKFRMTAMQRAIAKGPWLRMWSPKREVHYLIPDHVYVIARYMTVPSCGERGCIGCAGNYGVHKVKRSVELSYSDVPSMAPRVRA